MASWSESSSRAGGGKGNRWEVGGSKDLGGVSFTKEGCCRENELGLQALEGRVGLLQCIAGHTQTKHMWREGGGWTRTHSLPLEPAESEH